jgi:hypothetical protein
MSTHKRSRLPPPESASERLQKQQRLEHKDVLTIKHLRFVEFFPTELIQKKMSHRDPEWIRDVIMGHVHADIL